MFWFRTDQTYRSGVTTEYFEQRLVKIDDLVAASFVVERESVTLYIGCANAGISRPPLHAACGAASPLTRSSA